MITAAAKGLSEQVHYFAQFRQRAVTLEQLFNYGSNASIENLLKGARFLHKELPVRLAHRIRELETLPFGLSSMPSVQVVKQMYLESFRDLVEFPSLETAEQEDRFTDTLENIKQRHNNVVSILAKGIQELRETLGTSELNPEIREFLDRFYMSRIGIRMLIGQHIATHQGSRPGYAGLICEKCSPASVVQEAIANAQNVCLLHYTCAPEVGVFGNTNLTFTYLPSHLHHMLFELLKNSMRAVVEFSRPGAPSLSVIRVVIAEGNEDVTIKISDEGGGIPRSGISRIWTYLYTTAKPPQLSGDASYHSDFQAPMAGLGYGLPISRLYARYFEGDLQIISMEGYGTDAYLHLKRLGTTQEALPRRLH
jgi:pyruvate dehydrogenase kinase 2/3/4